MKVRMQLYWRRSAERHRGQVLDSESLVPDPDFASAAEEIAYHLKAGHAVPLVAEPERIELPQPEVREMPAAETFSEPVPEVEVVVETPAPSAPSEPEPEPPPPKPKPAPKARAAPKRRRRK